MKKQKIKLTQNSKKIDSFIQDLYSLCNKHKIELAIESKSHDMPFRIIDEKNKKYMEFNSHDFFRVGSKEELNYIPMPIIVSG